MRKILCSILLICIIFLFSACGENHGEVIAYGECDDNIKWEIYEDGFLSITGNGKMKEAPWLDYSEYIKSIKIDEGVLALTDGAFSNCANLESVVLVDGITEIPRETFLGCTSLKEITIPNSVTSIDSSAFTDCTSLKSIILPSGITSIAFIGCSSLENVTLPETVTQVNFTNCTSLRSIVLPEKTTDIYFSGCSSLESIVIPDSMKSIDSCAFKGCSSLKEVTFPDSLVSIESYAFEECNSLEGIIIPDSVNYIGESAFHSCGSLQTITIPEKVNVIHQRTFDNCDSLKTVFILGENINIEEYAFAYCWQLKEIHLPKYVEMIYPSAFQSCNQIDKVYCAGPAMPEIIRPYKRRISGTRYYEWVFNEKVLLSDFFEDAEVILDGNLQDAEIGNLIHFGEYEQDNNPTNGKEPIVWIVLDKKDGKMLVLSFYALNAQVYHESEEAVTWESSIVRNWLNSEFLDSAFSIDEKDRILTTIIKNSDNAEFGTKGGTDTSDKLFLLSIDEATMYSPFLHERTCVPTDFAIAQNAHLYHSPLWWLRSPGCVPEFAAGADAFGNINEDGVPNTAICGIRPALWIDISSIN